MKVVTIFPEKGDGNQHHALKLIFMEACIVCLLKVFKFSITEEKIKYAQSVTVYNEMCNTNLKHIPFSNLLYKTYLRLNSR